MTEELKEKLKTAKSKEELDKMLNEYGNELTEEDLEAISAGTCPGWEALQNAPGLYTRKKKK